MGLEVDQSSPSSAKVKSVWSYVPIPPVCFHGSCLSTGTTVHLC